MAITVFPNPSYYKRIMVMPHAAHPPKHSMHMAGAYSRYPAIKCYWLVWN